MELMNREGRSPQSSKLKSILWQNRQFWVKKLSFLAVLFQGFTRLTRGLTGTEGQKPRVLCQRERERESCSSFKGNSNFQYCWIVGKAVMLFKMKQVLVIALSHWELVNPKDIHGCIHCICMYPKCSGLVRKR